MLAVIVSGLAMGSIYALVGLGYTVTHLTSKAMNFAQANLLVLGMFLSLAGYAIGLHPIVIVLLLGVVIAGVSVVTERVAIRTLRNKTAHSELVTTLGVATIITGFILVVWGADPRAVPFIAAGQYVEPFGERIQVIDLIVIGSVLLVAVLLLLLIHKTRFGIAILAQSEDSDAASLRGVNIKMLSLYGFAIAGLIVGLLAPMVGSKTFAVASLSIILAIKGFVAITLGGVGSITGALIGGLTIGLIEAFTARFFSADYREVVVFLVFAAVLLIRPRGLFGKTRLRAV